MTDDLHRLVEAVDALTRPRTHREPFTVRTSGGEWRTDRHLTKVASLLDQLADALEPGGSGDYGHSVPSSRPTARLEAIDTLLSIDAESGHWVDFLGMVIRDTTADNLRALVGVAGELDEPMLHKLTSHACRWVTLAQVTTGWEVPPFRPDNTCPLCSVRGGLRVRVGDGIGSQEVSAICVECRETWSTENITLLGDHIKAENGEGLEATA